MAGTSHQKLLNLEYNIEILDILSLSTHKKQKLYKTEWTFKTYEFPS